jgi:hypothetical protein
MARYLIFEKTKSYDYKFKGSSTGTNGDKAIKNMKMRGTTIGIKSIFIAIPSTQFMKYQLNPTTKDYGVWGSVKGKRGKITTWKKPK